MHLGGDVVLLEAGFATNQQGAALGVGCGLADLVAQALGIATAADNAAAGATQQVRRQPQQGIFAGRIDLHHSRHGA
jgi:hypothetical protein